MYLSVEDVRSKAAPYKIAEGIEAFEVTGQHPDPLNPPITGTICKIDLQKHAFRIFPFYDLINKSLHPDCKIGCFMEASINLGASVRDFILGNRHECEGVAMYPEWMPPYRDDYRRCILASNTLQTNFIRSNGLIIVDGQVIAKPRHAPGRDDLKYSKLGPAGEYTCFIVDGSSAKVVTLHLERDDRTTDPPLPSGTYGIASPRLLEGGSYTPVKRMPPPFRTDKDDHLVGNCVDWDPEETASSFSAFGNDASGSILFMASVFAGEWGVHTDRNTGMLPRVLAELLAKHGMHDGILGGGSADVQQFVHGRHPRFRNGPVRSKVPIEVRGEVEGIRGLSAIAGVIPHQSS